MPEPRWIFDTVTLVNFLEADAAEILKRYGGRGIIPWQVYDEITSAMHEYPRLNKVEMLRSRAKFSLATLKPAEHDLYAGLLGHLGRGEAACIAIAGCRNHIVVTDDRAARRECETRNILYTGTIGILRAAVREARTTLDQADEFLERMIRNGFYSPIRRISDID